ncbi:CocE/NonD family hydrolase [Actinokineospora guangxiensis]|uniref:CocE/NonD family hydrolase n=1 Tax=Actinokineospora guangxiensis TaxID=1490288 RepID=A0ABW0ESX1_9PSEU
MRVDRDLPVVAADGTTLLVDHIHAEGESSGVVVWIRTPYGRKQITSMAKRFARRGADVVIEATRGTDGSGGAFDGLTYDAGDVTAVLRWLRVQPWFAGAIVTWGISAIGRASWFLAGAEIPEWRLAIVQDAPSELRDGLFFPGGAVAGTVMLGFVHAVRWQADHPNASALRGMAASVRGTRKVKRVLADLPLGTADERLLGHRVDYFQEWLAHENDDEYWARFNLRSGASGMPALVHLATGWYDTCLASTLADYAALRAAGKRVRLIIGPWYHGRGAVDRPYRDDVDTWIDAAARDTSPTDSAPVRLHVSGADEWRDLPDWPPPGHHPTAWHLQPHGGLSPNPAPDSPPDRFRYDPADPTPAVGGAGENWDGTAGAKDNRRLEARHDVLTFTSDPLPADLEVIGPVTASITMRSTSEHLDLVLRLCDVAPNGRSTNLCDGARRIRPDNTPPAPDHTRTVTIDLTATAHRFHAGHRIRLHISGGAHPRLTRNTCTGEPLTTATTTRPTDQEILHTTEHPSILTLPTAHPHR